VSQAGINNNSISPPEVPTTFTTDSGNATPAANILSVLGGTSTTNDTDGIRTTGSGSTVTIQLTNRFAGSGTSTDAVTPVTVASFPLGATPGEYTFFTRIAAYNSTDSLGASYTSFAGVRTTGAAGTVLGANVGLSTEEGAMIDVSVVNQVTGNTLEIVATGLAGKTINYVSLTEFVFAS